MNNDIQSIADTMDDEPDEFESRLFLDELPMLATFTVRSERGTREYRTPALVELIDNIEVGNEILVVHIHLDDYMSVDETNQNLKVEYHIYNTGMRGRNGSVFVLENDRREKMVSSSDAMDLVNNIFVVTYHADWA